MAGRRFVLRRLRRLGPLAPGIEAQVESSTPAEIEAWVEQIFLSDEDRG